MNKHLYLCHPLGLSSPTLMMHGHMNLNVLCIYKDVLNHQMHIAKTFNQCASVGSLHKCKYCFNIRIWKILTIKFVLNLQRSSVEMI